MAIQQISAASLAMLASPTRAKPAEPSASSAAAPAARAVSPEQVMQAVEAVKQVVAPMAQNLQFSIDDDTGKTIIRVVDVATKEVIRQIPSEELVAIARALTRLEGLLLDKEA